eukprot:scaffold4395_cov123-Isochrysis_galbana.AAC.4
MLAIIARQVTSHSHSCEFLQSNPSRQSGMVQPVVNEMFATVHAAGSSLLGLFTSCTTFDLTAVQLCSGCGRAPRAGVCSGVGVVGMGGSALAPRFFVTHNHR